MVPAYDLLEYRCNNILYEKKSFLIQVRPHLLLKVNFVQDQPQFLIITHRMRQ